MIEACALADAYIITGTTLYIIGNMQSISSFYTYTLCIIMLLFSISFFALIELILTALGFLFTLALGVVITIGTDDTCKAFEEINNLDVDTGYIP